MKEKQGSKSKRERKQTRNEGRYYSDRNFGTVINPERKAADNKAAKKSGGDECNLKFISLS